MWNEPEPNFSLLPKAHPSSPSHGPFKTYSLTPYEKSESTEPFEPESPKSAMSDGEGEKKTLRQWATQEVTQQSLCITLPKA